MANRFDTTTNRFDLGSYDLGSMTTVPNTSTPTTAPQSSTVSNTFNPEQFKQGITYAENRNALASGTDPYKVVGVTKDLGKYQVNPTTLSQWSQAWLGKQYTPQQFLNDPNAQEEFMNQFVNVAQRLKLTPEQAAAAWHKGWGELGTGKPQPVRDSEFFTNLSNKIAQSQNYLADFNKGVPNQTQLASVYGATSPAPTSQNSTPASPASSGFLSKVVDFGNAVSNILPGLRVAVGNFTGEDTTQYQQEVQQNQQRALHPPPLTTRDPVTGKQKINPEGLTALNNLVMGSVGGEDLTNVADQLAKTIAKTSDETVIRKILTETHYPASTIDEVVPSLVKATTPEDVKAVLKKGVVIGDARATLANAEARVGITPVTDPHNVQEIRNSIQEGRNLLSKGTDTSGNPLTDGQRFAIKRSIENAQAKIGEGLKIKPDYTINDVTPAGYGPASDVPTTLNPSYRSSDNPFKANPVEEFRAKAESQLNRPVALTAEEKRLVEAGAVKRSVNPAEYDSGYFGRKPAILPQALEQRRVDLELQKQALESSPFAHPENRYLVDREGRFRELGDLKGNLARRVEDRMAQAGITDPKEFAQGVEDYMRRKAQLAKDEQALTKAIQSNGNTRLTPTAELSTPSMPELSPTSLGDQIRSSLSPENKLTIGGESARLTTQDPRYLGLGTVSERSAVLPQTSEGELRSLELQAQKHLGSDPALDGVDYSFKNVIQNYQTPVNKKINILDYFRTPEAVLKKIGLGNDVKYLRTQYEAYLKELPQDIKVISEWAKEVPKESNARIFRYLDGQAVDLNPVEKKVASEIKTYLSEWADRLNLPEDKRIANYITHIFDEQIIKKEFDEDLAKIIADKVPSSVYDPFLQKRLGTLGYREDTWAALDAYTKRAVRKFYMDPALEKIAEKAGSLEESQWRYVKSYLDRVNMRPTDIDNLIDNTIKSIPSIGYKFGQRPVTYLSQKVRQLVYRSTLGLNIGSAVRNLTQGVNTYAELGERWTLKGYTDLIKNGASELNDVGVLTEPFIQDRTLSTAKQTLQKIDKGLFAFFDTAEKINRGAAYYGAKAKALAEGKTLTEAVEYGKEIVRKTQFAFGSIDTPVALQSDIMKSFFQLKNFTIKQLEFLGGKVARKEFAGLVRYTIGSIAMLETIGKLFGMKATDIIPFSLNPLSSPIPQAIVGTGSDLLTGKDEYGNKLSPSQDINRLGGRLLPFVPVGSQAKKTIQGLSAVSQGKDITSNGRTKYKIPQTPTNYIRAALFGKNNLPAAQSYFNRSSVSKPKVKANRF